MDNLNCHFLLQSSSKIFLLSFFLLLPFFFISSPSLSSLFLHKETFSINDLPWKSNRQDYSFSWGLLAFELQFGWQSIPKLTATTCHIVVDRNTKIIWQRVLTLNVEINLNKMDVGNGKKLQNNFILIFSWIIWDYYYRNFYHFIWNQCPYVCYEKRNKNRNYF